MSGSNANYYTRSRLGLAAVVLTLLALLAFALASPMLASAAPEESDNASSSSSQAEEKDVTVPAPVPFGINVGKDGLMADQDLQTKNVEVQANLFAAGRNLSINGGSAGCDLFASGYRVELKDFAVSNNAFVAGESVDLTNLSADNSFIAGSNLAVNGTMANLQAAGSRVLVSGTYTGNVKIVAQEVIIDPNIEVKGTLEVSSPTEPEIASTAKIANYSYLATEASSPSFTTPSIGSTEWLWLLLSVFLMLLVTAIFILITCRTETVDGMGSVMLERPWAVLLTGLIALIALPLLAVVLCLTVVGLPTGLALLAGAFILSVLSTAITAISIGRLIMGRINKWISTFILVALFALIACLPIAGAVLAILCLWYSLGLVIQGWWVWRRRPASPLGSGDDDFDFPRGAHMGASGVPTPPTPVNPNLPSSNTADYTPRSF